MLTKISAQCLTHLSVPHISSANSGHSQPLLSLRSARWLWPSVKIPPDDTGYQRHLYRLQNIGPANARYLGTNQQSSDFDIGGSQNCRLTTPSGEKMAWNCV